jgi:hypothetical protein
MIALFIVIIVVLGAGMAWSIIQQRKRGRLSLNLQGGPAKKKHDA